VGSSGLQTDFGAFVGSFGRLAQVKEEKAAGRELSLSPPSRAFLDESLHLLYQVDANLGQVYFF